MAPLKFADFTKSANDLLTNDYCFDRKFKLKTKTANGFELTSEGTMKQPSTAVAAKLTGKFKVVEGLTVNKVGVTNAGRFFVDASYAGAVDGLTLTTLVEEGGKIPHVGEVGVEYGHDLAFATVNVDAMKGPTAKASVSTHYEKFLLGGEVKYNTGFDAKTPGAVEDYNIGAAYKDSDFTLSVVSKNKLSDVLFGYYQTLDKKTQLAATYTHKDRMLTVGGSYALDASTKFQGKVNCLGVVSVNAHQVISPNATLIASAEVDGKSLDATSHKFGLQLNLA